MHRSRAVASCWLTLLILPVLCLAQSKNYSDVGQGNGNGSAAVVSARELAIPEKARAAFNKGIQRLAAKDWVGSIREFQGAIKAFPGYYEAYNKMGSAELALASWGDAEAAFRESIEMSGDRYAPPHFGLGLVLCDEEKQFVEAEAIIRAGIALDPTDKGGHFVLAWVLYSAGRFQAAEESARNAVFYGPRFADAWLLLAQIQLRQNKMAAVVEDLDTYLGLGPESPRDEKVRAFRADAQRALSGGTAESVVASTNP